MQEGEGATSSSSAHLFRDEANEDPSEDVILGIKKPEKSFPQYVKHTLFYDYKHKRKEP